MILQSTQLDKVCGKEVTRFALVHVNFNKKLKRLEASNGHALACLPVDETAEDDTEGLIPVEAIKAARKAAGCRKNHLEANGKIQFDTKHGMISVERPEGKYPVIEDVLQGKKPKDFKDKKCSIALNAELLHNLQLALVEKDASKGLKLYFDPENPTDAAIYVEPLENPNGNYGVIMPMHVK